MIPLQAWCGPRVGRGIALLFHDRGTRRGWVVSSTPRPYFTPGKDPVPILQEVGWTPGSVWAGGKSRPHRDSIPDRPARSQSLYRMSYPAHGYYIYHIKILSFPPTSCFVRFAQQQRSFSIQQATDSNEPTFKTRCCQRNYYRHSAYTSYHRGKRQINQIN